MPHNPTPAPAPPRAGVLLFFSLLCGAGCGGGEEPAEPAADSVTDPQPAAVAEPPAVVEPVGAEPAAVAPVDNPFDPATGFVGLGNGYGAILLSQLRSGNPGVVRGSLPPGAVAAIGSVRRALARAEPGERAEALAAVGVLAEVLERNGTFVANTTAVQQAGVDGVRVPGWAPPLLRAVATGPAATGDPGAMSDAELIDGTVAVLLQDPTFAAGLKAWEVKEDIAPTPPDPEPAAEGEPPQPATGAVVLAGPGGAEATVPVVASDGRWVPVVVEATLPTWAARADGAGGTGAAAVLAAALPHLRAARDAGTQDVFDEAIRQAVSAGLAATAGPPEPVTDGERVTVLLTRPLTARQAAEVLAVLEAATDDPRRSVARAAPRPNDPGWRVSVGPVADIPAFLDRTGFAELATADGRTVTLAYTPPDPQPPTEPPAGG